MKYFVGINNSKFVDDAFIDQYINSEHRENSVFGLSKKEFFWVADMKFRNKDDAFAFITKKQSEGFEVFHNFDFISSNNIEDVNLLEEDSTEEIEVEEAQNEEKQRKAVSRSRGKK